jgi:hypothetical protein
MFQALEVAPIVFDNPHRTIRWRQLSGRKREIGILWLRQSISGCAETGRTSNSYDRFRMFQASTSGELARPMANSGARVLLRFAKCKAQSARMEQKAEGFAVRPGAPKTAQLPE